GMEVEAQPTDIWAPVVMQAELRYTGNMSNANGDPNKPWIDQHEISWLSVMLRIPKTESPAGVAAAFDAALHQDFAAMAEYGTDAEARSRLQAVHGTLRP